MEIKTRFAGIALAAAVVAAGAFFAITAGRPADRFLTFDGLDPVKIGMTLAEAEEVLNAKLMPLDASDGNSSEACWYTNRADGVDQTISYMIWDGKIVRIDVDDGEPGEVRNGDSRITTERGIRVGSSESEIKNKYSSRVDVSAHPYGNETDHYIRVLASNEEYGLLFETWNGKVSTFRAGTAKAIALIEGCS